jgi:hypothetical protein
MVLQSADAFQGQVDILKVLSDSAEDAALKQRLIKLNILDKLQEAFSAMQVSLLKPISSDYVSSFHWKIVMDPQNRNPHLLDEIAKTDKEAINDWMESPEFTITDVDAMKISRDGKWCEFCITPSVLLRG